MTSVTAVVVHYGNPDDTRECVKSLAAVTDRGLRTLVIDNGAPKPFESGDVEVWRSPENLGFAGACNAGCARAFAAGARWTILLNNDLVVDPGFVEPLVERFGRDASIGAASPKVLFYDTPDLIWAYGARIDRFTGRSPHIGVLERDRGQYDAMTYVDRLPGCSMAIERSTFERVGPFDERFFLYSEETDWCIRARRAGFRLAIEPRSKVWHRGHRATGREGRGLVRYYQIRNQLELVRKHRDYFCLNGWPAIAYLLTASMKEAGLGSARPLVRAYRDYCAGRLGRGSPP